MWCFGKNIDVDVFDDVLQNAKHRANDASNDINRLPLIYSNRQTLSSINSSYNQKRPLIGSLPFAQIYIEYILKTAWSLPSQLRRWHKTFNPIGQNQKLVSGVDQRTLRGELSNMPQENLNLSSKFWMDPLTSQQLVLCHYPQRVVREIMIE